MVSTKGMMMEQSETKMTHDEAVTLLRWVVNEFNTCLAEDGEADKINEAMRVLQLSVYDHERRRFL